MKLKIEKCNMLNSATNMSAEHTKIILRESAMVHTGGGIRAVKLFLEYHLGQESVINCKHGEFNKTGSER